MNTDNINFNELWSAQKAEQPSIENLLVKMKDFKKSNRKRIIFTNVILVFTSIFILLIWLYYKPQWVTTKVGITLTILAMIIFVIVLNRNFTLFKDHTSTLSNNEYLNSLLEIKANQQFIQTKMLNLYFILLSIGIALYMYEYASLMNIFWAFFSYGITLLWLLFNWFYLRPKQIKKQQKQLDEIIEKFKVLSKQMEKND